MDLEEHISRLNYHVFRILVIWLIRCSNRYYYFHFTYCLGVIEHLHITDKLQSHSLRKSSTDIHHIYRYNSPTEIADRRSCNRFSLHPKSSSHCRARMGTNSNSKNIEEEIIPHRKWENNEEYELMRKMYIDLIV